MKKKVLFLCTHNSARSQIAEGLANALLGEIVTAQSAGTIRTFVKKPAIDVMAEIGIDISNHYSKTVETFRNEDFDYVVTVCDNAREACPFFPGKRVIHVSFDDPSDVSGSGEDVLEAFRKTRDQIKTWIESEFMLILSSNS